jgi:threonine dehydrogenase-like Zn-dependent dehydrogenase
MRLQAEGVVDLQPLISHVIPFENAGAAFRILDQEPENGLQVVLDFTNME